jgi:hypothetical protein
METDRITHSTPETVAKAVEISPFGQKVRGIILEDQQRVARVRGAVGVHLDDRAVIQFGETMSALILANYLDEKGSNVTVKTTCKEKVVFGSELMETLLTKVKPGKPARAEGIGLYHYGARVNLIGQNPESREDPGEKVNYDVPVNLSFKMRLSRDAKKVVVKVSAKRAGKDAKTEPIVKTRMVFKAFSSPDFRGKLHQRLSAVTS